MHYVRHVYYTYVFYDITRVVPKYTAISFLVEIKTNCLHNCVTETESSLYTRFYELCKINVCKVVHFYLLTGEIERRHIIAYGLFRHH